MKKIRIFLQGMAILVSFSFFLFNCDSSPYPGIATKGGKKQALKYNDNLVKYQRSVEKKIYALNAALKRLIPQEIKNKLTELQEQIEMSADTVSQIEGFEGDTSLRDAFLDQLEFYESLYNEEGQDMIEGFLSDPPAENLKELIENFNKRLTTECDKLEKKLMSTQHAFFIKYKLEQE